MCRCGTWGHDLEGSTGGRWAVEQVDLRGVFQP